MRGVGHTMNTTKVKLFKQSLEIQLFSKNLFSSVIGISLSRCGAACNHHPSSTLDSRIRKVLLSVLVWVVKFIKLNVSLCV